MKMNLKQDNSVVNWVPESSAVCRLGSDLYPDNYVNLDYPNNNFHEAYSGIEHFSQTHGRKKQFIDITSFKME